MRDYVATVLGYSNAIRFIHADFLTRIELATGGDAMPPRGRVTPQRVRFRGTHRVFRRLSVPTEPGSIDYHDFRERTVILRLPIICQPA